MQSPPTSQEPIRFLRPKVEFLAFQPFVSRQDDDESEGDDEQEKKSTDKPSPNKVVVPDANRVAVRPGVEDNRFVGGY